MAEPVTLHPAKEPTYKASDIVTRISLGMDVGGGQLAFETHIVRDAPQEDFREQITKLLNAAEYVRAKHNLKILELSLETKMNELDLFRRNREDYIKRCETEWSDIMKRKGELKLSQSQQNTITNFDNSIESRKKEIEKTRHDITVTKGILAGTQ